MRMVNIKLPCNILLTSTRTPDYLSISRAHTRTQSRNPIANCITHTYDKTYAHSRRQIHNAHICSNTRMSHKCLDIRTCANLYHSDTIVKYQVLCNACLLTIHQQLYQWRNHTRYAFTSCIYEYAANEFTNTQTHTYTHIHTHTHTYTT